VDIKEIGKCGIVARQEVIERRWGVKNQLRVKDIFGEGLIVNGTDETE